MQASTKPVILDSHGLVSKVLLWNVGQETKLSGQSFNVFSQSVQANAVTYISYVTMRWSINYCEGPTMPYVGWCLFAWCSYPITGLDMRLGQREVQAPKFHDTQHMSMVRLSSLHTGCLYPLGVIPGTHFC